jgi:molybdenum cofactor cytidylyltransferase
MGLSMNETSFRLGAILLAAGFSVRMRQPKLLLPWGTTSILGHLISQWRRVGAVQVMVVHSQQDGIIRTELDRLSVAQTDRVANPTTQLGMFSSIVCAAQSPNFHTSLTHYAIVLGDQPHLRQSTLIDLVSFAMRNPERVCQPEREGSRRHPVLLPKNVFLELAQSGAATFKQFLQPREIESFECDDPGLDLDIDCPEDYQRALALAGLASR